jgi:riboflavin kinase
VKPYHVDTLKQIALRGGVGDFIPLSSKDLGKALGVSQQSASQRILELLDDGMVTRDLASRRQRVKVSPKGLEVLQKEYADYLRIFEVRERLTIVGRATSGLGEGAFYMRQKGYREQFRKKLGYEPYEGTLNLKMQGPDVVKLRILVDEEGIPIDGFEANGRTFGGAKCFPSNLKGIRCAVIIPIRTHYTDTVEVISKEYLRGRLGIADGDSVTLELEL